ncbi:MAG: hypothetical protein E7432_01470 [Ruminococcaceae bacterium]|nr:hypothetical protein [Oscillospiraceae bacterium]
MTMSKEQFIARLKNALSPLSAEDIRNAVEYYEEYFADAGEENQADVISALGSPEALAENIIREAGQPVPVDKSTEKGDFNAVNIKTIAARIEFIPSDHYGYEFEESTNCTIEHGIANGVLTVRERKSGGLLSLFGITSRGFVKVYFKAGTLFDFINLSAVAGSLTLENIKALTSDISLTSGGLKTESCDLGACTITQVSGSMRSENCRFAGLNIHSVSGSTHIENAVMGNIVMKNTSGSIKISGNADGDIEIRSVSGSIKLMLEGKADDYRKSIKMSSGSCHIGGMKIKGGYTELSDREFLHNMTLSTVSGSINIDFR